MQIKNRIAGSGTEAPADILANPFNFRGHPKAQRQALDGAMRELGWIQQVIINRSTGHLIDGHLRVELAMERDEKIVPVVYVELTEREEKIALASLDPIGAMAEQDQTMLDELIDDIGEVDNGDLQELLEFLHSDIADEEPEPDPQDDEVPELGIEHTSKPGDIWIMGAFWQCETCGQEYPYEEGKKIRECPCDL
jgi:hypothetical protein